MESRTIMAYLVLEIGILSRPSNRSSLSSATQRQMRFDIPRADLCGFPVTCQDHANGDIQSRFQATMDSQSLALPRSRTISFGQGVTWWFRFRKDVAITIP